MAWACQSSGDCCRLPAYVVMTLAERRELEAVSDRASRPLTWRYHPSPRYTMLEAGPCPFVTDANTCAVYDVRPFNCRRFGCMRADVGAVAFGSSEMTALADVPEIRAEMVAIQAEAQPWALAHSWKVDAA